MAKVERPWFEPFKRAPVLGRVPISVGGSTFISASGRKGPRVAALVDGWRMAIFESVQSGLLNPKVYVPVRARSRPSRRQRGG